MNLNGTNYLGNLYKNFQKSPNLVTLVVMAFCDMRYKDKRETERERERESHTDNVNRSGCFSKLLAAKLFKKVPKNW